MKRGQSIVAMAILVALFFPAAAQGKQPAYQFSGKEFDSGGACPAALISADGQFLARCTVEEGDEGPPFGKVTILPLAPKAKGQEFPIAELPADSFDKEFTKNLKALNTFLKKRHFVADGKSIKDLSKTTTIKGRFVEAVYQNKTYRGSTLTVKLASKTCCNFTGLSDIVVFPNQGVMVGLLVSECRDNEHPTNPCDCDGQYPMDEEDFRFCPTATSGTVVLRAEQSAKKTRKKTDGK